MKIINRSLHGDQLFIESSIVLHQLKHSIL